MQSPYKKMRLYLVVFEYKQLMGRRYIHAPTLSEAVEHFEETQQGFIIRTSEEGYKEG